MAISEESPVMAISEESSNLIGVMGLYSIARVSFRTSPPRSDVPIHILTLDHQFIRRLIALTHVYMVQIQFALGAMCENLPLLSSTTVRYEPGRWWCALPLTLFG